MKKTLGAPSILASKGGLHSVGVFPFCFLGRLDSSRYQTTCRTYIHKRLEATRSFYKYPQPIEQNCKLFMFKQQLLLSYGKGSLGHVPDALPTRPRKTGCPGNKCAGGRIEQPSAFSNNPTTLTQIQSWLNVTQTRHSTNLHEPSKTHAQ